jgi:hypothetical protein
LARDRDGEVSSLSEAKCLSFSLWRLDRALPFAATLAGGVDSDFRELGVEGSDAYGDAGIGGR